MSTRQRLKLRGKTYVVPAFDEAPLKAALLFDVQADELGIPERWTDIEEAAFEAAQIDPDKDPIAAVRFSRSRPGRLVIAATVWLAMRHAGEDVTLSEATEIRESEIDFVAPPKDHRPPAKKTAKKATKSTQRSGRAAGAAARK